MVMKGPVEFWKKHPDIDGIEVSSFGRVRSVKGYCYKSNPGNSGYLLVQFYVNGKHVTKNVHRLVAEAFITNPNNLPDVNHKDSDKTNNNANNLEWVTHLYNIQYRDKFGNPRSKPVFAVNLTTLDISRFQSQHEASRILEVNAGNLNSVISGRTKQAGGYLFVNDDEKADDIIKCKLSSL